MTDPQAQKLAARAAVAWQSARCGTCGGGDWIESDCPLPLLSLTCCSCGTVSFVSPPAEAAALTRSRPDTVLEV